MVCCTIGIGIGVGVGVGVETSPRCHFIGTQVGWHWRLMFLGCYTGMGWQTIKANDVFGSR